MKILNFRYVAEMSITLQIFIYFVENATMHTVAHYSASEIDKSVLAFVWNKNNKNKQKMKKEKNMYISDKTRNSPQQGSPFNMKLKANVNWTDNRSLIHKQMIKIKCYKKWLALCLLDK